MLPDGEVMPVPAAERSNAQVEAEEAHGEEDVLRFSLEWLRGQAQVGAAGCCFGSRLRREGGCASAVRSPALAAACRYTLASLHAPT